MLFGSILRFRHITVCFHRIAAYFAMFCVLVGWPLSHGTSAQENPNQNISSGEILAKVQASYQGLETYRLTAVRDYEERVEAPSISASDAHRSSTIALDISAAGPSKGSIFVKNGKHEIQSFTDGHTVWTFQPEKKKYSVATLGTVSPSGNTQSANGTPEDAGALKVFERVLVDRYRSIARIGDRFVRQKDRTLEQDGTKIECYVFKMTQPREWHEIWVDKGSFIVRRSVDYTEDGTTGRDARRTTLTLTLKSLDANAKFDESAFSFTPPAGAKQVSSIDLDWTGRFGGLEAPPVR